MTPQVAYEIMLKDEGAFDPALMSAFVSAMGLYPPGNHVRLSDGSQAVVVSTGPDIDKPRVRLTHSSAGQPLGEGDQRVIDISDPEWELTVSELLMEPEKVPQ
jgi:hypothetical protein